MYQVLDSLLAETIAGNAGFPERVQPEPVLLEEPIFQQRSERLKTFQRFFETTLDIFRESTFVDKDTEIKRLLYNDIPDCFAEKFHARLPQAAWTVPQFFRTDESKSGAVFEIQSPGSGWGDLQLLRNAYLQIAPSRALHVFNPCQEISREIIRVCQDESTSVLHLLDNSSNPSSMRYLIAHTQPPLRYWGYEASVRNSECRFIRSHSFYGLINENLFDHRLGLLNDGRLWFDLPPLAVFDQKLPLCLPFLDETSSCYDAGIREILIYSYPVRENGFRDVDGSWVKIEEFLNRAPSQRRYFLKYGGCDVSINWGSRAVFRLDDREARNHLIRAVEDSRRNRYWVIQPEVNEKETVSYVDKETLQNESAQMTAKYSCFYGPSKLLGIRTMHRGHFKVHGQAETVVGLALSNNN